MIANVNYSLLSVYPSLFSTIEVDILPNIFKDVLPSKADKVALLCKSWQKFVDSQEFRDAFRPLRTMGIKELKTINPNIVDAGIELHLPRCAYRDYINKGVWFVFDPGIVKLKNDDGQIEDLALNTLRARGKLCNIEFTTDSWDKALDKERKQKLPCWTRIDTTALCFSQTYAQQQNTAREEDKKVYPERYKPYAKVPRDEKGEPIQIVHMADANAFVLAIPMAKALFNEIPFNGDPANENFTIIRTKTLTKDANGNEWPIVVNFAWPHLRVNCNFGPDDIGLGFVFARKFFAT